MARDWLRMAFALALDGRDEVSSTEHIQVC